MAGRFGHLRTSGHIMLVRYRATRNCDHTRAMPDRILFQVKGFCGSSLNPASPVKSCLPGRYAAGWYRDREWLVGGVGTAGVSLPRLSQSRFLIAPPGPRAA